MAMVSIGGCLVFAAATARGVEPPKPQNRVEFQVKVHSPWLAKVPILKEIFAQAGQPHACEQPGCEQKAQCQAGSCPLAVDFEFPIAGPHGPVVFWHGVGPAGACQVCPLPASAGAAVCSEAKCLLAECGAGPCCQQATSQIKTAACPCDNCQCCAACPCASATASHTRCGRDKLVDHLIEISAERAALEATLEAHSSLAEEREEAFSTVAELMAENARLTAKIEFQGERDELTRQLLELATQNAQLKAEVALAEATAKLTRESLQLALENERLQGRVAELERRAGDEGVRTARQPKAKPAR
jgi:hypothetical protein